MPKKLITNYLFLSMHKISDEEKNLVKMYKDFLQRYIKIQIIDQFCI